MIARAEKIAAGQAPLKKTRFLKVTGASKELDQATIDRARQLAGLKGYVTNLPVVRMPGQAVISAYHDLWVRHEALCNRVEVEDLHRQAVAAAW